MAFSSSVDAALRQFNSDIYEDAAFRKHVLMGIMPKKAVYGNAFKQPLATSYTAGIGGTFSNAQSNQTDVGRVAYLVSPFFTYAVEDVANTDIAVSENKAGAVVDLLTDAIEKSMRACGDQLEMSLFGDGSGTIGTISSNTNPSGTTYVLTLTTPSDALRFGLNQVLVSKATAFAGSLDTGTALVTATDLINGTVTVTAQSSWTPTNGHVLGVQGTMLASTSIVTFPGLTSWITNDSGALSASFFGVTRSTAGNQQEVAGWVLDGTSLNIQQAINQLAQQIGVFSGAEPDKVIMSYANYAKLLTILDNKARNIQTKGAGITVYYDSVEIFGPAGKLEVIPSSFCPSDKVFILDSKTWQLGSPNNKPIRNADPDRPYVALSSKDALEVRMISQCYVTCSFPGANGYITVTP